MDRMWKLDVEEGGLVAGESPGMGLHAPIRTS